jgi:hypothetical protein
VRRITSDTCTATDEMNGNDADLCMEENSDQENLQVIMLS